MKFLIFYVFYDKSDFLHKTNTFSYDENVKKQVGLDQKQWNLEKKMLKTKVMGLEMRHVTATSKLNLNPSSLAQTQLGAWGQVKTLRAWTWSMSLNHFLNMWA